jgi:hypothetical protein
MFLTMTLSSCFTPCNVGSVIVILMVDEGISGMSSIGYWVIELIVAC